MSRSTLVVATLAHSDVAVVSVTDGTVENTFVGHQSQVHGVTFNTAGTWAYHCEIHAYMRGTITVLAAGQTPPATDTLRPAGTPTPSTPWLSIFAALAMVGLVGGWLVSRQLAKRRQGVEP